MILHAKVNSRAEMREVRRRSNVGVIAGLLGCLFGTLGILTIGLVFVPLAAICAAVGLLRGIFGRNAAGIGLSLLAWITVAIGIAVSPTVWIAFLAILGSIVGDQRPH